MVKTSLTNDYILFGLYIYTVDRTLERKCDGSPHTKEAPKTIIEFNKYYIYYCI